MTNALLAMVLTTSMASTIQTNFKTTTIQVAGMSCGGCAAAVKHALTQIDGIREARVSYEKGEAVVTYDSTKITPEAIAHSAEQKLPGYKFAVGAASGRQVVNALAGVQSSSSIHRSAIDPERVSFYEIGLVCPAAPKIGCGGHSKPVLNALTKDSHVAGAWINGAGTRLAIGWKSSEVLSSEQIDQIISGFGVAANEVSRDARLNLIASFHSDSGWFDAASVDQLSEQEAGIIAARLVKRLTSRAAVTPAQQAALRDGMARALRANFIEGDRRDLDQQLIATSRAAKLSRQAVASLREVVELGIYPLPNEQ